MSFDDGSLKFLSLSNSADDTAVTGKPFIGTKQQGLHSYHCSSFPIWSVHVSRATGTSLPPYYVCLFVFGFLLVKFMFFLLFCNYSLICNVRFPLLLINLAWEL